MSINKIALTLTLHFHNYHSLAAKLAIQSTVDAFTISSSSIATVMSSGATSSISSSTKLSPHALSMHSNCLIADTDAAKFHMKIEFFKYIGCWLPLAEQEAECRWVENGKPAHLIRFSDNQLILWVIENMSELGCICAETKLNENTPVREFKGVLGTLSALDCGALRYYVRVSVRTSNGDSTVEVLLLVSIMRVPLHVITS